MPRRTWLDSKISVLLEELAESGMHLDRQRAGELITRQVRAVAALMGVTEASARRYLGDEAVKDMARRMLFEIAAERPGADLLEAPRTVPVPLVLVGITVAALAEAMQIRAANEPPDHLRDVITTYAQVLSGLGSSAQQGDVLVVDNGGRADEACIGDLVALEAQAAGLGAWWCGGCTATR